MRKIPLPETVTPDLLDKVLRDVLKLKPLDERIIRLRLAGMTQDQIVEGINADLDPGDTPIYPMKVSRVCVRSHKNLYEYLRMAESAGTKTGSDLKRHPLYHAMEQVLHVLVQAGHEKHTPRPRSDDGHLVRRPSERCCRECRTTEWTYRTENRGGHRNFRIYICRNCRLELTPQEYNALAPCSRTSVGVPSWTVLEKIFSDL